MSKVSIVKIGGNVTENPEMLRQFLEQFVGLEGQKILVHGGGKRATELANKMGIPITMLEGRRITDAPNLELVVMVYAGWINKNVTAKLQALGGNAIGISGADANAIKATKRPASPVDYGFVGDIEPDGVNTKVFNNWIEQGIVPVVCAITHDGNGQLLNTNADTIAAQLAMALAPQHEVNLMYCFEKDGVLDAEEHAIPELNITTYQELKQQGVIHSGMIPKLDNAFEVLNASVAAVTITSALNFSESNGTRLIHD